MLRQQYKTAAAISLAWCGFQWVFFLVGNPNVFMSGDAASYLEPAQRILAGEPWQLGMRLPGYPLVLAAISVLELPLRATVFIVNVAAIVVSALCAWRLSELWFDGNGLVAMIAVLINPLSIIMSHVCGIYPLFTACIAMSLLSMTLAAAGGAPRWNLVAGLFVGGAILLHEAVYLLLTVPAVIWLAQAPRLRRASLRRYVAAVCCVILSAFSLVVAAQVAATSSVIGRDGFEVIPQSHWQQYVIGQAAYFRLWDHRGANPENLGSWEAEDGPSLASSDRQTLFEAEQTYLIKQNLGDLLKSALVSQVRLVAGGAAGLFSAALGAEGKSFAYFTARTSSYADALWAYAGQSVPFFTIFLLVSAISVGSAMLALSGTYRLLERGMWPVVAFVALFYVAFAVPPLFFANGIYRLPLIPLLSMLVSAAISPPTRRAAIVKDVAR